MPARAKKLGDIVPSNVIRFNSGMTTQGGAWLSNFFPYVKPNALEAIHSTAVRQLGMQATRDQKKRWCLFSVTEDAFDDNDDPAICYGSVEEFFQRHKWLLLDPDYLQREELKTAVSALEWKQLSGQGAWIERRYTTVASSKERAKGIFKERRKKLFDPISPRVMYLGLLYKFSQNPALARAILDTKEVQLEEVGRTKSVWNNKGENLLGTLLASVRALLKDPAAVRTAIEKTKEEVDLYYTAHQPQQKKVQQK